MIRLPRKTILPIILICWMPKGIIMMHVKIGCTRNPNHYEQGGGLDTGIYQHIKTKK
jgi:hypothetical protein